MSLKGWKLDDAPKLDDAGSDVSLKPFSLPDIVLGPGERALFFSDETRLFLSDGGYTIRILNSSNKVYDAYTYSIVKLEDKSICRLPDGNGSWYEDCLPTPDLANTREGTVPSMPDNSNVETFLCSLPDTLPADFLFAECRGYGSNIWDAFQWDQFGWLSKLYFQPRMNKWEVIIE